MKSLYHVSYGTSKDLEFRELPKPVLKPNEVMVKIKSASLNATDVEIMRGDFIIRLANGLRKPSNWRLGCDFAGIVDQVGAEVNNFKIGDEVYADLMYNKPAYGSFAEYISIPEIRLRKKPDHLTFNQAATIPQAGVLAVQGIRDYVEIGENSSVLINGAGGGVGSFAIQIAKHLGAHVTGVDSQDKSEFIYSLGADDFIDYQETDFTKTGNKYDLVVDVISTRGFLAHRRALKPGGHYRLVGGSIGKIFRNGVFGALFSKLSSKKVGLLFGRPNDAEDMEFLSELIKQGSVEVQIDRIFPFDQVADAIDYIQDGKSLGKVIVTME